MAGSATTGLTVAILEGELKAATASSNNYMYIVELALKHTALPLTVQKKDEDAANETYKKVLDAIASGNPVTLELTCDKVTGKKVAIAVSELAAVQVYEKSGSAGASGRAPGFFALAND